MRELLSVKQTPLRLPGEFALLPLLRVTVIAALKKTLLTICADHEKCRAARTVAWHRYKNGRKGALPLKRDSGVRKLGVRRPGGIGQQSKGRIVIEERSLEQTFKGFFPLHDFRPGGIEKMVA